MNHIKPKNSPCHNQESLLIKPHWREAMVERDVTHKHQPAYVHHALGHAANKQRAPIYTGSNVMALFQLSGKVWTVTTSELSWKVDVRAMFHHSCWWEHGAPPTPPPPSGSASETPHEQEPQVQHCGWERWLQPTWFASPPKKILSRVRNDR